MHESSLYENNMFVTLTYGPEHLPKNGTLSKRHFKLFMKKLRKHCEPNKIRFFSCGEYGDKFKRPHYHALIFNYQFNDLEIKRYGKLTKIRNINPTINSNNLYYSETLKKIWKKGHTAIGDVSFESAGYVARYALKKITGDKASEHYNGKEPEFAAMSRAPGIGGPWIEKYMSDVYPKDFFTMRGIKMRPNRFYDERYRKRYPDQYEKLKEKRRTYGENHGEPQFECKRQWQAEYYRKCVTKPLQRSLENG